MTEAPWIDFYWTLNYSFVMLTEQHIEEGLSFAYVAAVAARAGLNLSHYHFDYGVDCSIHEIVIINGKRRNSGISLDLQLKASINFNITKDYIIYDLEVKTYNYIVNRHSKSTSGANPCILALLCLPKDSDKWLEISEDKLLMRRCCYWTYLKGQPVNRKESFRIKIPKLNFLSPEALRSLLSAVKTGAFK